MAGWLLRGLRSRGHDAGCLRPLPPPIRRALLGAAAANAAAVATAVSLTITAATAALAFAAAGAAAHAPASVAVSVRTSAIKPAHSVVPACPPPPLVS